MPPERATILLTGATGFVGGQLLTALAAAGPVRCLVRDASRLERLDGAVAVEADLEHVDSLRPALEGIDEVYYLVHSMEPGAGGDYATRDRRAAENYARIARDCGIRRTIYLGGIRGGEQPSEHLRSRHEVERILAGAADELVAVRASMIVGARSASFRTLAEIVDRLPVLAFPTWRDRRTQPVGIDDVVACLVAAREVPAGAYEIAGPDELTFAEMTEVIAELLAVRRPSLPLPFSSARLEALAAATVTSGDRELLEPLMEGLHGDLLVRDNAIERVFGVRPATFREAARRAIEQMDGVEPRAA
ncbi:MAG TPA: NAD(P)H-binding protein [Solirubrobacteraceae bacterium]